MYQCCCCRCHRRCCPALAAATGYWLLSLALVWLPVYLLHLLVGVAVRGCTAAFCTVLGPLVDEMSTSRARLVVVGDIHGHWDAVDEAAVQALKPDAVLFVGDFGNEDTRVVRSVASLAKVLPVAAVLGNHDAWHTTLGAIPDTSPKPPSDRARSDGHVLKEQLALLGETHVGFARRDMHRLGLSVVGGRPCIWGGGKWESLQGAPAALYSRFFGGLQSFEESAERIVHAAAGTPEAHGVVLLAHNGPAGLGDARTDIVGRDFGGPHGGDHGDPDLAAAVAAIAASGRPVPLVAFGHMHDAVDGVPGARQMVAVRGTPGGGRAQPTVYLNAAVVPRRRRGAAGMERCFILVTLTARVVETVAKVWLGPQHELVEEKLLYTRPSAL